ncbi:hypothetical protein Sste5346_000676 [Sporothrix stenoceras]|uniref:Uncharacterized protein n=1 Tax=Sporothrix stenoceras TaxID=5173 RepID=A0ABR3ZQ08_9PEZI
MDSITVLGTHDEAKSLDTPSLSGLPSAPMLAVKYGKHTSDLPCEAEDKSNPGLGKPSSTSKSQDVDLSMGNEAVLGTQPVGLSGQQMKVLTAEESKKECAQLSNSLIETTQTTVSLASKQSASYAQKSPLSSTLKPSTMASLHESNGRSPNFGSSQDKEGNTMGLNPPVGKSQQEPDSQYLEQIPGGVSAATSST